jgi:2-polyprenyl-3-methyl-5-hydroxy-6-metoxy-1,4-benzoquinol methylase
MGKMAGAASLREGAREGRAMTSTGNVAASPDRHGDGLLDQSLEALRYDGYSEDPHEVTGILREMMPSGVRVLDVGCGAGPVTLIANRGRGNTVLAIEPDPERAAVARSRGLTVHAGVLDEAFLAEQGGFDVVMSSDVLEHLAAPAELLQLMARALRPGGLLLISAPNVAHWTVRSNLLFGRFDYEATGIMDATHLRWFTRKTLANLIDRAGFDIVEMRAAAGIWLPVYDRGLLRPVPGRVKRWAVRALARALPRLFGVQHVVKAQLRT